MTAEPLPLEIMEWMGMDETMVPFVLDSAPDPADAPMPLRPLLDRPPR
ncbi:hypothetical protein [Nocardioides abyssi]|uniref:Uncharacterized protein n=1 Tax=Nocardioides abyssi TaxID=3058370 RepID=A0ABT8EYV0_9ACTN|nr:hypothetical protein [Nocardioides abyssi]MDN4163322.1 hypothetical protein [Nocardioides abyssi]